MVHRSGAKRADGGGGRRREGEVAELRREPPAGSARSARSGTSRPSTAASSVNAAKARAEALGTWGDGGDAADPNRLSPYGNARSQSRARPASIIGMREDLFDPPPPVAGFVARSGLTAAHRDTIGSARPLLAASALALGDGAAPPPAEPPPAEKGGAKRPQSAPAVHTVRQMAEVNKVKKALARERVSVAASVLESALCVPEDRPWASIMTALPASDAGLLKDVFSVNPIKGGGKKGKGGKGGKKGKGKKGK